MPCSVAKSTGGTEEFRWCPLWRLTSVCVVTPFSGGWRVAARHRAFDIKRRPPSSWSPTSRDLLGGGGGGPAAFISFSPAPQGLL